MAADIATTLRNEGLNLSGCYVTSKDKTLFADVSGGNTAFIFRIRKSKEVNHAGAYVCIVCNSCRKINKLKLKFPLSL